MIWQQVFFITLFLVNSLLTIGMIGKRRDVITPAVAVVTVILNIMLMMIVISI